MLKTIAMTCYTAGARFAGGPTLPWLNRWALSACQARRVFPKRYGFDLVLNTDARGQELLIGKLGLPFDEVITYDLPRLPVSMGWLWSLPKVSTYRLLGGAKRAFLHLDYDFKFWRRPPDKLLQAPAFAQHTASCPSDQCLLQARLSRRVGGLLLAPRLTCNAGILGGNDTLGLHAAACAGLEMALAPGNQDVLRAAGAEDDWLPGSLIEETAIANFFGGKMLGLLSETATHADWDRAGCAHEAGDKTDKGSAATNEFRLFTEHPEQWRRTRDAWLSLG